MQWSFKQLLQPQEVEDIWGVINVDHAVEWWGNLVKVWLRGTTTNITPSFFEPIEFWKEYRKHLKKGF
jgi:hypothetical protein